jgi:hypothetical protein
MVYVERFRGRHPYEDRDTEYVFAGVQKFDEQSFPLYTADGGEGTTVSLETIRLRDNQELLDMLGIDLEVVLNGSNQDILDMIGT